MRVKTNMLYIQKIKARITASLKHKENNTKNGRKIRKTETL